MRLLRSFPFLAFLLVLMSIVGLCVSTGSAGLLLVAGVLSALSWYVTEGPRSRSLPNWTRCAGLSGSRTISGMVSPGCPTGSPMRRPIRVRMHWANSSPARFAAH